MSYVLHIGNKNYSSWSLRGWLLMKASGAPFEEKIHQLHVADSPERLKKVSPNGRVPCLVDGENGVRVWDSLAICEYLAETFPGKLWPEDRAARAAARSVVAEMHSGFMELRTNMPMNVRGEKHGRGMTPGVAAEIERVREIWRDCRGKFLFGESFGAADCFYAPVVMRFRTYGVKLDGKEVAYAQAVWDHPWLQEWVAAARIEEWTVPEYDAV